jgi:Nitrile hydratase beta subunit
MKKVHDMGGKREEFGPVDRNEHEVEDWERLADAVNYILNAKGHKTTDEMRRAIESLENYREMSYYERWAAAAEMLVVEKGLLTQEEIDERAAALERRWGAG